jgi:predicted transcriptional regulator
MRYTPSHRILELKTTDSNLPELEAVIKALGSETRLEILSFLGTHTCSVLDIADNLKLPQSTITMHITILEKAGLIKTDLQPAKRGVQKVCARLYDRVNILLPSDEQSAEMTTQTAMPVGAYTVAQVTTTCGLLSESGFIGELDDPASFYEAEHFRAQLIWFRTGFVEYRFPHRPPAGGSLKSIEISAEVCSEAPLHHDHWPSDITLWINGVEIATWTSPSDYGGEPGLLTPTWWDVNNTQYGQLKTWRVTEQGSFIDTEKVSPVALPQLNIGHGGTIAVRIGVKEGAQHVGGINIFGSRFGNYPQDILLREVYA